MYAKHNWVKHLEMHTLRWLVKGPGSSWLIAGTFAVAGFGAATLNAPSNAAGAQNVSPISGVLVPDYSGLCHPDPDGDGHIFCDSSVVISQLPASYGHCFADTDGDGRVFCDGQGQ